MAERDLNHEAMDYILPQERALSDALRAGNLSSDLRSQLEIELLLVRGARIMATFHFQEETVGRFADSLTRARIAAIGRLNPEAAKLGILNVPVEEISMPDIDNLAQSLGRQEG